MNNAKAFPFGMPIVLVSTFVFVVACAPSSSKPGEAENQMSDETDLYYALSSGQDDTAMHAPESSPFVIDSCNFTVSDSVALVEVVGTPTIVDGCQNNAPGDLRRHFNIPVKVIDQMVGNSSSSTMNIIALTDSSFGEPQQGELLLVSLLEDQGDSLVVSSVYVNQAPDFVEHRVKNEAAIDLPSTMGALRTKIAETHEKPQDFCSADRLSARLSRGELSDWYRDHSENPCESKLVEDNGLPQ